jgi:hypothetical protein
MLEQYGRTDSAARFYRSGSGNMRKTKRRGRYGTGICRTARSAMKRERHNGIRSKTPLRSEGRRASTSTRRRENASRQGEPHAREENASDETGVLPQHRLNDARRTATFAVLPSRAVKEVAKHPPRVFAQRHRIPEGRRRTAGTVSAAGSRSGRVRSNREEQRAYAANRTAHTKRDTRATPTDQTRQPAAGDSV